ncbi:MAG: hypothetical protein QM813_20395 [Verrucomicrobiota bacterium]
MSWTDSGATPTSTLEGFGVFSLATTNGPQNYYRLQTLWNPGGGTSLSTLSLRSLVTPVFEDQFCGPYRVFVR